MKKNSLKTIALSPYTCKFSNSHMYESQPLLPYATPPSIFSVRELVTRMTNMFEFVNNLTIIRRLGRASVSFTKVVTSWNLCHWRTSTHFKRDHCYGVIFMATGRISRSWAVLYSEELNCIAEANVIYSSTYTIEVYHSQNSSNQYQNICYCDCSLMQTNQLLNIRIAD